MSAEKRYKDPYPQYVTLSVIRAVNGPRRHIYDVILQAGPNGIHKKALSQQLSTYTDRPGLQMGSLLYGGHLPYPSLVLASSLTQGNPILHATEVSERFLEPVLPIAEKFYRDHPDISPLPRVSKSLFTKIALLHALALGTRIDTTSDKCLNKHAQQLCRYGYTTSDISPELTRQGHLFVAQFLQPILSTLSSTGVGEVTEDNFPDMQKVMKGRRSTVAASVLS